VAKLRWWPSCGGGQAAVVAKLRYGQAAVVTKLG